MFPDPIYLGPLQINYYGLMVACGALAALALFSLSAPKRGLTAAVVRDFSFWMILSGLAGSRLAFIIFHWDSFPDIWSTLAYWKGGLMFQGGVLGALLISPFVLRRYNLKFWDTADVIVPSLALGQAFGRLGCLAAGCCYGRPVGPENPLGISFPEHSLAPSAIPLWPTQAMESFALFVLSAILLLSLKKLKLPGHVAALYLILAGLVRFIMEIFFRGDFRGEEIIFGLPPTSITAFISIIAGFTILLLKRKNKNSLAL